MNRINVTMVINTSIVDEKIIMDRLERFLDSLTREQSDILFPNDTCLVETIVAHDKS